MSDYECGHDWTVAERIDTSPATMKIYKMWYNNIGIEKCSLQCSKFSSLDKKANGMELIRACGAKNAEEGI